MQIQNLAALAAAASVAQNPGSMGSALTSSNSPLSVLTSSGEPHMFFVLFCSRLDNPFKATILEVTFVAGQN